MSAVTIFRAVSIKDWFLNACWAKQCVRSLIMIIPFFLEIE